NPRAVTLSIGVDDRTNTMVLACSELMYKDISTLVTKMDAASATSTRTVRVVNVKGIDPLLVQQTIDAIQGRGTWSNHNHNRRTFGNTRGNFGNTNMPRTGFQPGGIMPAGNPGIQPGTNFQRGGPGGGNQRGGGRMRGGAPGPDGPPEETA